MSDGVNADVPSRRPRTLRWEGGVGGHLVLLDQTQLPGDIAELHCRSVSEVWGSIKRLSVRGAPAIGVAAAYGVCLSLLGEVYRGGTGRPLPPADAEASKARVFEACDYLATSRPTAVNLFWALERMRQAAACFAGQTELELAEHLLAEARTIHDEDRAMCAAMGRHGADLVADLPYGAGILTHCNAGALATGGDGSGLSPVFELARRGRRPHVWVDETRPLLQGARLTAWELMQRGIDCTLICDSMAAHVMRSGKVQAIFVGADRIAANGDAANKIGTYGVAVLAEAHGIPLYVVAPTSTIDMTLATGAEIPIEERAAEEVTEGFGRRTAPAGVRVYNPAFDVTPYRLIKAIVTERGVFKPK